MAANPTFIPQDQGISADLDRGYTLPAGWYTDPNVFALEQDGMFRRCWQYAGLLEWVRSPGDFFTCAAGDVPIVVVGDGGGTLRAFVNVCRHRGSVLVHEARGHGMSLQCRYHAWTYNLDGSLRAAPGSKAEPGFDPACFSLVPVAVDAWGPFVFVNPSREAPPLRDILGELPALVAATGLDLDAIRHRVHRTYEIAANWKVVVDNYLECYHCPVAHPGFRDLLDLDNYSVAEYEYFSTQGGPTRSSMSKKPYTIGAGVEDGFYAYLWPNFTLNVYPGPGNVSINLFLPIDVGHTLAIYDYCFVDAVTDAEIEEFTRFVDQVQEEDIVLCESVQHGLRSGFFDRGTLMLTRERALQHFQKLVYRFLTSTS